MIEGVTGFSPEKGRCHGVSKLKGRGCSPQSELIVAHIWGTQKIAQSDFVPWLVYPEMLGDDSTEALHRLRLAASFAALDRSQDPQ